MEIKYADNVTLTVEITDQIRNSEKIRGRKRKGTGRNIGE